MRVETKTRLITLSCSRRVSSGSFSLLLPPYVRSLKRLVQIMKKHLKSAVADGLLSDIELSTQLAEVESVVNNRLITAVSADLEDCSALTPNHFLLQRATQLPPGVFVEEDSFSRKQWGKVQVLANRYWKRRIREYLPTLQKRPVGQVNEKCADG